MKDILKNLGILSIIIGVVILSIVVFKDTDTNTTLAISLILIIVGLIGHILLNKYMD